MNREFLAQNRHQVDVADTGIRLRLTHRESASGEINVAPAQFQRFTDPQASKSQGRQ